MLLRYKVTFLTELFVSNNFDQLVYNEPINLLKFDCHQGGYSTLGKPVNQGGYKQYFISFAIAI
jgi:hypothetical protein